MIVRETYLNKIREVINTEFIKVIIGIRRSGKTFLLKSIINELKLNGVDEKNIFYISFESVEYSNIRSSKQLDDIVLNLIKNIDGKIYLFFDEIQQVEGWEISINSYNVSFDVDIYISGSNSKLLSGELATHIAGRYITIDVYPFSFKEVLQYKNEINNLELNKENINNIFNEYLIYGGMPSLLILEDESIKLNALEDIYNSIIVKDILSRYSINEIDLFKRFVYYLMNSVGQTFSKVSITKYLKNEIKSVSRNTISNYTNYIVESLFCNRVLRQDILGKKLLKTSEKYYLTDHGFHHALVDDNGKWIPRILENIVYIELLRRGYSIKIGKVKDLEIDFVCKKNNEKIYIQVTYLLSTEKTIKREFAPLYKIPDNFPTYVLSMDNFDMSRDGIKHLNIIDFLLGDEI